MTQSRIKIDFKFD